MTDYLTLTEFIPGTKAKAQEVNANFLTLKNAINQKASIRGDSTQIFATADALQASHAVNKKQLDALSGSLSLEIAKTSEKFCVKSGNTTNGLGDLFSYNLLTITPKIGGTYANLVVADYKGTRTTITSAATISMSGKPDGVYNIFIKPDGTFYTLNNTIYRQAAHPTMLVGDVWFNTSVEPFSAIRYDGTSQIEFLDVPLGKVTVASSTITAIQTFAFNQNGYNINYQSQACRQYDFSNGISKNFSTTYTAESDGLLYILAGGVAFNYATFTLNGITFNWTTSSDTAIASIRGGLKEVEKGDTYSVLNAYTYANFSPALKFYPRKGV